MKVLAYTRAHSICEDSGKKQEVRARRNAQVMTSAYQALQRSSGFLAFGLKFTD